MSTTTAAGFHDLDTMIEYMAANCDKIKALTAEIAEVQHEFEGHFVQAQQRYGNAKAAVTAWAEAQGPGQPAWLRQALAQRQEAVCERERKRMAELQKQLTELLAQQAGIERENDDLMQQLRTQNPALDAREEELKRQEEQARNRFAELQQAWHQSARGLRWLLAPGAVRRARAQMQEANAQWADIDARLAEVRNSWAALKQKTDETENTLHSAWRLRTAEIARLKHELTRLQRDFDAACREAALDEILSGLKTMQASDQPDFDRLIAEVLAAHDQADQYESGIAQVAELIGLIGGVCEGLTRMAQSVLSVREEQEMHAELADLRLSAPEEAVQFHRLWDDLQPLVRDEKQAAEHPAQFAAALKQAIGDRLSDTAIDAMFTSLGDELNRATSEQWG